MIFPGSVAVPGSLAAVRDAEVGHQRAAGARLEQDVVRLHVAVHDAASVRVGERPRHLAQHARRVGRRERAARAESLAERLALHVAHDEEDEAARLADAMDRDDVRVREAGRRARLAQESLARLGGAREVRRQDLDGDVAIELHVAREVDDAHAAAAELALERVLAGQGGLQVEELGGGIGHDIGYEQVVRDVSPRSNTLATVQEACGDVRWTCLTGTSVSTPEEADSSPDQPDPVTQRNRPETMDVHPESAERGDRSGATDQYPR